MTNTVDTAESKHTTRELRDALYLILHDYGHSGTFVDDKIKIARNLTFKRESDFKAENKSEISVFVGEGLMRENFVYFQSYHNKISNNDIYLGSKYIPPSLYRRGDWEDYVMNHLLPKVAKKYQSNPQGKVAAVEKDTSVPFEFSNCGKDLNKVFSHDTIESKDQSKARVIAEAMNTINYFHPNSKCGREIFYRDEKITLKYEPLRYDALLDKSNIYATLIAVNVVSEDKFLGIFKKKEKVEVFSLKNDRLCINNCYKGTVTNYREGSWESYLLDTLLPVAEKCKAEKLAELNLPVEKKTTAERVSEVLEVVTDTRNTPCSSEMDATFKEEAQ